MYIDGDAFPDSKSYDIVVKSSGIKFNTEFLKINDKKVVSDLELRSGLMESEIRLRLRALTEKLLPQP